MTPSGVVEGSGDAAGMSASGDSLAGPNDRSRGRISGRGEERDAEADGTETEAAAGEEQVVSYLDAMDEKPRGRIMTELAKSDPALATRLLGRIRDRAQFAPVPGNAGS